MPYIIENTTTWTKKDGTKAEHISYYSCGVMIKQFSNKEGAKEYFSKAIALVAMKKIGLHPSRNKPVKL